MSILLILLIPITFIYLITGWDGWGFALYTILFVAVILEYLLENVFVKYLEDGVLYKKLSISKRVIKKYQLA
jgi:hypothetical protein